jgi:glucose-6-phosphate 1-dehydrogenase
VDHFLAKQTVQNVMGLRFANRVFSPLWCADHIERVDIVFDETLALEGRAGYYDRAGALRDMIQNHLLQLMCLVAMEPPGTLDERQLRDAKRDVLAAVRPPAPEEMARDTMRGRYTAGVAGGRQVPDYAAEAGVDPARGTETYARVTLRVDTPRWRGVPFVLRSGKALDADRHGAAIRLRAAEGLAFGPAEIPAPNVLRLEMNPDRMTLSVNVNGEGDPFTLEQEQLACTFPPQDLPTYGRLLLDVLEGDVTLAIRADEAEEAWRVVEPILAEWGRGNPPLREYPGGSEGPEPPPG